MSKSSKALAGATAVAAGPSGLRRLAAGCLMVLLLGGLALGGLLAFAAWTATHNASQADAPLPCPPKRVGEAWSTKDAPSGAREAMTDAIRASGREAVEARWGDEQRDLVVIWTPGTGTTVSTTSSPVKITLGSVPTASEVRAALGARLAPCEAPAEEQGRPHIGPAQQGAQESQGAIAWPWERGLGLAGVLGLVLGLWWLAGPNVVRAVGRALGAVLWPLRLGWRRCARWGYRRRLAQGLLPATWPLRVTPGQRWHEDEGAMRDHRTFRAQIAETEPARRAALRAAIRAERLEGIGIGPASIWRCIYRTTAPKGAPEMNGVSS